MPLSPSPDPWSMGINAAAGVATAALKPVGSEAHNTSSSAFDNSGWNVNIGPGASQTSSRTQSDLPTTAQALGAAAASGASLLGNPIFIIAIGLGVFLFLKHK